MTDHRMDIIWAPWRMAYITGDHEKEKAEEAARNALLPPLLDGGKDDCFLCQAAVCPQQQFPARYIVHRSESVMTLLNRYPYNNGHLLIAPRRHIANLSDLTILEWEEISRQLTRRVEQIRRLMNAEGFNVGLNLGRVAGAGVPGHLHWHIVPRWNGDTNFVTTIGAMKAIPQSLEAVCELLRQDDQSEMK
ncbi:MAG: HIT domain-containing protein [Thermoguttaceae bacterium]|nr:HIT domain-containing protein [Thermoguttaceae bacterium]